MSGLTLAGLGTIDTLLTSVVADNLTKLNTMGIRLIGQGIGIRSALFGGLPGAGSLLERLQILTLMVKQI